MYICENCNKLVGPNIPSQQYPLKLRKKIYPFRANANQYKQPGRNEKKKTNDPGGVGFELEKEIAVCPNCYQQLMDERPV